jgi:hypothetical protein
MAERRVKRGRVFLLVGVVLAMVGAAAFLFRTLWQRKLDDASFVSLAKRRPPKDAITVYVDPLPMTMLKDTRFKCGADRAGLGFNCSGVGWETLTWKLERDTSTESIDAIIERARQGARDELATHEDADLPDFRGFIDVQFATRMPVTDVTFTGFRDDAHGRLKLTIAANGWRSEGAPQSTDVVDVVGMMLSTKVTSLDLLAHLPDSQDLQTYAHAEEAVGELFDDAKPEGWTHGATQYAVASAHPTDAMQDYFARVTPIVRQMISQRFERRAHDLPGTLMATSLAESLFSMDKKDGGATAEILADDARKWSPEQPDAAAWIEIELRLAVIRALAADASMPMDALTERLSTIDRKLVLRDPRNSLELLADKLPSAKTTKLLEAWMNPTGIPDDADFGALAAFALAHTRLPFVQRHVLAMLGDHRRAGDIEPRTADVLFHGKSEHAYGAVNLPPTKATREFRVCDVYAAEAARQRSDLSFNAWATEKQRDAEITPMLRSLSRP